MNTPRFQATQLRRCDLLPDAANSHDQVMGSLLSRRPGWLVDGDLLEPEWVIATPGSQHKQKKTLTLDFNAVIDCGGIRLTDKARIGDLLSAKLIAFRMLQQELEGQTVYCTLLAYFWFVRWRLDTGIFANSDLVPALFDEFVARLSRGGRVGLIDFGARVTRLKARISDGSLPVDLYNSTYGCSVRMDRLAYELGLQEFQSLPNLYRADIIDFLEAQGYRVRQNSREWRQRMPQQRLGLGAGSIQPMLDVWRQLWRHRVVLAHDALPFDPYATRSYGSLMDAICAPTLRTGTIPVEQASFLADRALRWVVDYSPELLRLLRAAQPILDLRLPCRAEPYRVLIGSAPFSGPSAPSINPNTFWRCRTTPPPGTVTLHDAAFHLLATACAIVIALFSARRKTEITSLQSHSLRQDDEGRDWLEVWVSKTLRDFDTIPVPASVRQAINVLCELSAAARAKSRESWLFDFLVPSFGTRVKYDFCRGLRLFAAHCGVPALPQGGAWTFKPHQFRRFFSLIYDHSFDHSSLRALSEFLGHADLDMTAAYTSEVTKGELARNRDLANARRRRMRQDPSVGHQSDDQASVTGASTEGNSYDHTAWYRPMQATMRSGLMQRRRELAHLPVDWEEAVKDLSRLVDVQSPRASIPRHSFNSVLEGLNLSDITKGSEGAT